MIRTVGAVRGESQDDLQAALRGFLDHLKDHPWDDRGPNQMVLHLALGESRLYMVGLRRGMQPVDLLEKLADLLISPESIGDRRKPGTGN